MNPELYKYWLNRTATDSSGGYVLSYQAQYTNDGLQGNGSAWISNRPWSWVKIDLGQEMLFGTLRFGRDRLGYCTAP